MEVSGAPLWARHLREDIVADLSDPWTRDNWRETWRFRRQASYLKAIDGRTQLKQLAERKRELDQRLSRAMAELVRLRTYIGLHTRMTKSRLAALVRFVAAIRKIGAGTGIRARRYRSDARQAMLDCMGAVPCWIMPAWRVSETLPAELGSFDLVIVDEASQSDAMALPALLRGQKILVVGDDKQVSPTPIGLEERRLLQLRQSYGSIQIPGS
jgi:hypothetical protein